MNQSWAKFETWKHDDFQRNLLFKKAFKMSDSIFASNLKSTCQYFSGPISGKTISRSWRPINRSNDLTKTQNQEIVESSPTLPIQRSSCCFYCHWKTFTFTFLFGKLKRPICYLRWERSLQIGTLARLVTPKMVLLLKGNPFPNALHSGLGILVICNRNNMFLPSFCGSKNILVPNLWGGWLPELFQWEKNSPLWTS